MAGDLALAAAAVQMLLLGIPAAAADDDNGAAVDIARASVIIGVVQDALLATTTGDGAAAAVAGAAAAAPIAAGDLAARVDEFMARFDAELVAPAAAKIAKAAKSKGGAAEAQLVTLSKHLWARLAKAPAHKQPAHAQFLTSALRPSGARRLDCLGLATAALALCRALAARDPSAHGCLARAELRVSDDHSWIALPWIAPAAAAAAGEEDGAGGEAAKEWLHFEVTDCRALKPGDMDGRWLYGGGHGVRVPPRHVPALLAAAMAPEELDERSPVAARRMRVAQGALLQALLCGRAPPVQAAAAADDGTQQQQQEEQQQQRMQIEGEAAEGGGSGEEKRPCLGPLTSADIAAAAAAGTPYSVFTRWALLAEEDELDALERAADAGDVARLRALLLTDCPPPLSQRLHAAAVAAASGWQVWPAAAAAWGWLNLAEGAFTGSGAELVALSADGGGGGSAETARAWADLATALLARAAGALLPVAAVIRRYAGRADVKRDEALAKDVRELLENLADAFAGTAQLLSNARRGGGDGGDGDEDDEDDALLRALAAPMARVLDFVDAFLEYLGDAGELEAAAGGHFIAAAAALDGPTRAAALSLAAPGLWSARLRGLAENGRGAWLVLNSGDVLSMIQLPSARGSKRRRVG